MTEPQLYIDVIASTFAESALSEPNVLSGDSAKQSHNGEVGRYVGAEQALPFRGAASSAHTAEGISLAMTRERKG